MAEHPNVGLFRKGYEAFAKGDMATLRELFSEDVVWHVSGNSPISGEYRGQDAVFAFFARIAELSGGTFRIDLHDVVANDEHAVALVRSTASRQGKQLDSRENAHLPRQKREDHGILGLRGRPAPERRLLVLGRPHAPICSLRPSTGSGRAPTSPFVVSLSNHERRRLARRATFRSPLYPYTPSPSRLPNSSSRCSSWRWTAAIVKSPRVRSRMPRMASVVRRSPPVIASGKSIVTSTS